MTHRMLVTLLSLFGLIAAAQLSGAQLAGTGSCPKLGPVPACHIVSGAYLLVFISVMLTGWLHRALFLLSWLVVFALAITASILEFANGPVCPRAMGGVPQCYFSAALALAIGMTWFLGLRASHRPGVSRRLAG